MSRPSHSTVHSVSGFLLLLTCMCFAVLWAWVAFQSVTAAPMVVEDTHVSALRAPVPKSVEPVAPNDVAKVVARAAGIGGAPQATEAQDAAFAHAAVTGVAAAAHRVIDKPVQVIQASLPSELDPRDKSARTPRIAIIIDDMGLAVRNSIRATQLPGTITLSYLPYASNLQQQVDDAKARGHEIMLHMPMEALDRHMYAGPGALTTKLDEETFRANLNAMLNSFKGFVGVNNHMGSRVTSTPELMNIVMDAVDRKGVYFVDSWTSPRSVAYQIAASEGLPRARRDIFLDHYEGQQTVWNALAQAERLARRTGSAIVIGHPKNDTLNVLQSWLPAAQKRGVQIVPASKLLYDGPAARDPVLQADAARGHVVHNVSSKMNAITPAVGTAR